MQQVTFKGGAIDGVYEVLSACGMTNIRFSRAAYIHGEHWYRVAVPDVVKGRLDILRRKSKETA